MKLEYHAEGVLHGYWTSGGGPVDEASRHGIWLLRCFFGERSPAKRVFLLASEDNGSKWLPKGGGLREEGSRPPGPPTLVYTPGGVHNGGVHWWDAMSRRSEKKF
ncbi:hypothetical protein TNCV_4545131 [Trichonephila clavipes]|nr:hypothetical protein TNCV_4545131 [Trichonephila clavipes]